MTKWEEIYEDIREQILSGKMLPGSLFPKNFELQKIYNAQTVTVQQAVNRLIQEGLVITNNKRGKGALRTVREIPKRSVNYRKGGFPSEFGERASEKVLDLRIIKNQKDIPEQLQDILKPTVLFFHTEQSIDGKLVSVSKAYITNHVPTQKLYKLMSQANASLYGSLEYLGFKPTSCEESLICDFATKEERKALGLSKNSNVPIVRVIRKTYDANKRLIEICPLVYCADRYEFVYQFDF